MYRSNVQKGGASEYCFDKNHNTTPLLPLTTIVTSRSAWWFGQWHCWNLRRKKGFLAQRSYLCYHAWQSCLTEEVAKPPFYWDLFRWETEEAPKNKNLIRPRMTTRTTIIKTTTIFSSSSSSSLPAPQPSQAFKAVTQINIFLSFQLYLHEPLN